MTVMPFLQLGLQVGKVLNITESTADPDGGTGTLSYVWQSSTDETT